MSENQIINAPTKSSKNWVATLLFFLFLGGLSVHRFYVGKIGTGILQILTAGGLGIWWLIDFILIVSGAFTDSKGHKIQP
ncbi:MAG: TM2 domain-containing protein [Alistipes sp.]|jgi:TM2 domain-containing membrane protein YozV|nr:TM2 domain-containing protein [Alistipes sp.]